LRTEGKGPFDFLKPVFRRAYGWIAFGISLIAAEAVLVAGQAKPCMDSFSLGILLQ
jgi:hypothetical protein